MPEHDLLMQLNRDIKTVCQKLGTIEEKLDNVAHVNEHQCKAFGELEDRVSILEKCRMYDKGLAAGVAAVVSVVAWLFGEVL